MSSTRYAFLSFSTVWFSAVIDYRIFFTGRWPLTSARHFSHIFRAMPPCASACLCGASFLEIHVAPVDTKPSPLQHRTVLALGTTPGSDQSDPLDHSLPVKSVLAS